MLTSFSNKICEKVELLPNISSTNATGGVQKEFPRGGAGWGRGRETYQQKDTQGGVACLASPLRARRSAGRSHTAYFWLYRKSNQMLPSRDSLNKMMRKSESVYQSLQQNEGGGGKTAPYPASLGHFTVIKHVTRDADTTAVNLHCPVRWRR